MDLILPLIRRLNEGQVEFIIIGGVAASLYGSTVPTYDLDVCSPMIHENNVRIIRALQSFHPRWRMRSDLPEITPDNPYLPTIKNLYLRTDLGLLDVLGELPGVCPYDELKDKTVLMTIDGFPCKVLHIDTLIQAKRVAGRDKDLRAITDLERVKRYKEQNPGLFE